MNLINKNFKFMNFFRFTYHGQAADDVQISPDLCLIGCVFFFSDHLSKQSPKEIDFKARLTRWKKNISNHGGLVEETYNKVRLQFTINNL